MNVNNWKREREKAAWRQRRIILNNDGCDVCKSSRRHRDDNIVPAPDSPEAFWARRCTGLEGSQVDSIFYCTSGNFNQQNYDSRIAELF